MARPPNHGDHAETPLGISMNEVSGVVVFGRPAAAFGKPTARLKAGPQRPLYRVDAWMSRFVAIDGVAELLDD